MHSWTAVSKICYVVFFGYFVSLFSNQDLSFPFLYFVSSRIRKTISSNAGFLVYIVFFWYLLLLMLFIIFTWCWRGVWFKCLWYKLTHMSNKTNCKLQNYKFEECQPSKCKLECASQICSYISKCKSLIAQNITKLGSEHRQMVYL